METASILLSPYFLNFFPTPSPSTSPAVFVALFLWLNVWSCLIWCFILLNDVTDLHLSNLGTLVPETSCYEFHAKKRQVYWRFDAMIWVLLAS